jgi:hypothetical protein
MQWLKAFSFGPALRLALLAAPMLAAGCLTPSHPPLFTSAGPGWRVKEGQALWRPGRQFPELGGELVMASHDDGRCVVEFAKTPLPLVTVQTTSNKWFIEFPARRMSFGGRQPPPTRFAWAYLPAALSGDSLPGALRFQRKSDGGWRLENTRSGETVEGFLSP